MNREDAHSRAVTHDEIVANGMVDVATELRLTDVCELMMMIRSGQAANIADLVNSSSEMYFKSGTLRYALSAGCSVQWDQPPVVRLDLEFRNDAVCAFFRLMIGQKSAGVEVVDVLFDQEGLGGEEKRELLTAAIANARLSR
jgi:hypothetical protein